MSFRQDLEAGQEIEQQFVDLLNSIGVRAGLNTAKTQIEMALYDIYDASYITYEIKFDRRALATNNVFLEHTSLIRTHANYVVYKLDGDDNFYILDSPSVKNLLDNPDYITKSAGSSNYLGTLVPLGDFRKLFKIVTPEIYSKKTNPKRTKKEAVAVS